MQLYELVSRLENRIEDRLRGRVDVLVHDRVWDLAWERMSRRILFPLFASGNRVMENINE